MFVFSDVAIYFNIQGFLLVAKGVFTLKEKKALAVRPFSTRTEDSSVLKSLKVPNRFS